MAVILFLLVCVLFPIPYSLAAFAQSTNASVTGYITDPTKAVIVGAKVVVINVDTNARYESITNNVGSYDVPALPPGRYRIEVEKPGFKTVVKSDLILHVQDTAAINFEMAVGSASEIVTVEAGGLVVNTTDATVSTTIDRNFAENLPLNGRSFVSLILLTPGTVVPLSGPGTGLFSVNGQRTNSNDFTVDGVSANLSGFLDGNAGALFLNGSTPSLTLAGTTQGMLSVDTLQEFKIQTSTYAPEFGRQPGGQVSLLTRSGTNAFHGTAFDYLRNTVFDANNWFNNAGGLPKAAEHQNDFGGTVGGPVFKDKTFFFFSYEGLRLLVPESGTFTVPSISLRRSAAPVFQPFMNAFPIPNGTDFGNGGAQFLLDTSQPTNLDAYSIRIDHAFGQVVRIFGRYSDTSSTLGRVAVPVLGNMYNEKLKSRVLTLGAAASVSPNLNNELRLNYSVNTSTASISTPTTGGAVPYDPSALFPAPLTEGIDLAQWSIILPGVVRNSSYSGPATKSSQRQITVLDNTSYSLGSHQFKWGVDYRRLFPFFGTVPARAQYVIRSESDLAAGVISRLTIGSFVTAHPIFTNFSAYGQDTWKASRRLSVTYGLRWELNPTPGERDHLDKYFLNLVGINNPSTASLAPPGTPIYKTKYNNFAPRIGVAYQLRQTPGHETVVRSGLGVFDDLNSETFAQSLLGAQFSNSAFQTNIKFPANNAISIPPWPVPQTPPYPQVSAIDPNLQLPYTLQWNVSVEQGLGQNQSLTASYVASAGRRLLRTDNLFDFGPTVNGTPSFTNVSVVRNVSSSSYQSLQVQFNRQLSSGFQALASYTYSHSIDNASSAGEFVSGSVSGTTFVNPNIDRGNSSFDVRHAFRTALSYNIPTWKRNRVYRSVFGGWSVETISIAQTGFPVDLVGGFYFPNASPDGFLQLRPNLVPGIPLYLHGAQFPGGKALNNTLVTGACPGGLDQIGPFCPVPMDPTTGNPTQVQGTLGRNVLRGFGAWQIDFGLHRQFNITERVNLQFRGEFFNIFNHPNFDDIDNTVGDSTFGLATKTLNNNLGGSQNPLYAIGGPRSVQLALKLSF